MKPLPGPSILPDNPEELFKKSVPDPKDAKTRWTNEGKGDKAVYHRFQSSGKDESTPSHWNGSTKGKKKSVTSNEIRPSNVPER